MLRLPAAALFALGAVSAQTQLTIYNQNFASVKERRSLPLTRGESEIRVTDITAHLEPDSVVLRHVSQPDAIRILEQNYESDPLSEALLLRKSEGKTLKFEITLPQSGEKRLVEGRVLRSGYVPHTSAFQRFGQQYAYNQMVYSNPQAGGQPIVEVEGKIQFGLPGRPVFDALDPKAFLKPTLLWKLWSGVSGPQEVEFSYLTGGMRWEANYNAVAPEKGDNFDITGWVTIENMSGKDFEQASIKLMAGDVARIQAGAQPMAGLARAQAVSMDAGPTVTERSFEEYHLYTLERPATVLDREIKQVEFVRAANVPAERIYVYDGYKTMPEYRGWDASSIRTRPDYGTASNSKVWTMIEFRNSAAARLGMPLPKGKVKLYRRDRDGRNEFIGEDGIDHTPKDETVRLYTGNAFDLVGERRQTAFKLDTARNWADESFEIKVRNCKSGPVEVRVVEHLYRWVQWDITTASREYRKTDARTIEFRPAIAPGQETVIRYTAHYSW